MNIRIVRLRVLTRLAWHGRVSASKAGGKRMTTDVWKLETADQDFASDDLNHIIDTAMTFHGNSARAYCRHLWNEKWPSIKSKLMVEGSAWYVWYMDGVNHHLCHLAEVEHDGFH